MHENHNLQRTPTHPNTDRRTHPKPPTRKRKHTHHNVKAVKGSLPRSHKHLSRGHIQLVLTDKRERETERGVHSVRVCVCECVCVCDQTDVCGCLDAVKLPRAIH